MTANLLKNRIITYTQRICNIYGIPMVKVKLQNAYFDYKFQTWCGDVVELPVNPYKNDSPILLTPTSFLNVLPEINASDFCETIDLAERLRNDFNYEVDKNLDKQTISKIALENYDLVKEYINIVEKREVNSFGDLMKKTLRYVWYELSKEITTKNKFKFGSVLTDKDFYAQINEFVLYYKNFVELRSGYKLLWNENRTAARSEEDVQLLFKGILDEHCRASNIDLTREVNQGMGPVDFRFSSGYVNRVLLEVKLAKNSKFWNGLKKQLPQYLKIDSCKKGIFLVLVFTDKDVDRIKEIENIRKDICEYYSVDIKIIVVDARVDNKLSASKLQ